MDILDQSWGLGILDAESEPSYNYHYLDSTTPNIRSFHFQYRTLRNFILGLPFVLLLGSPLPCP